MANKVTDLFKKSSSYDKKHIKNLSNHYHVYYKSFGKLCFCLCDENGKRLARGTEVWKKKVSEAYIKKAA